MAMDINAFQRSLRPRRLPTTRCSTSAARLHDERFRMVEAAVDRKIIRDNSGHRGRTADEECRQPMGVDQHGKADGTCGVGSNTPATTNRVQRSGYGQVSRPKNWLQTGAVRLAKVIGQETQAVAGLTW